MVSDKAKAAIALVAIGGIAGAAILLTRRVEAVVQGSLAGRVIDAGTSLPVAGALVESQGRSTTSDVNGNWALAGLTPGPTMVTVSAPGYSGVTQQFTVVENIQTTVGDIPLTPTAQVGEVFGAVRDATTLLAVEGATVTIAGQTQVTPATGIFDFFNIPVGTYMLTVSRSGYSTLQWTVNVVSGPNDVGYVDLIPTVTTGSVAGTVTDSTTGLPVSGALVAVNGLTTTTGASGNYLIVNVPEGNRPITVSAPGYQTYQATTSVVTAGQTTIANVSLIPLVTAGTVVGRVTDSVTGLGVSGAAVTVSPDALTVNTDVDGYYSIANVPEGSKLLTVIQWGYDTYQTSFTVTAGQTSTVNASLTPTVTAGSVAGRIIDGVTSAPIVGASVTIAGQTVPTDSNGNFSVSNISAGTYTLTVSAAGYGPTSRSVTVVGGQVT